MVRDFASGLVWQQSASKKLFTLSEAEKYIEEMNRSKYGGYNNWRLPTLEEALLIFDFKLELDREGEQMVGEISVNPLFSRMIEAIWTSDISDLGAAVVRLRGAKSLQRWMKTAFEGIKDKRDRYRVLAVRSN